jgi:hypothetical protein
MTQNMGSLDRGVRVTVALVAAALFFSGAVSGVVGGLLLAAAAIFVLTASIGWCPLYVPLGISTRRRSTGA